MTSVEQYWRRIFEKKRPVFETPLGVKYHPGFEEWFKKKVLGR